MKTIIKENFYQFEVKNLYGEIVKMDSFQGKVVLVVNTASKCALAPQFAGLEQLYKDYKDKGFVVLGFPCNQFANQEPGDEKSITEVCQLNYGVSFPMFSKIDVNGKNAHPLFIYLKNKQKGVLGNRIKWNFTKFLIGRDGTPIQRFAPNTKPERIEKYIQKALLG